MAESRDIRGLSRQRYQEVRCPISSTAACVRVRATWENYTENCSPRFGEPRLRGAAYNAPATSRVYNKGLARTVTCRCADGDFGVYGGKKMKGNEPSGALHAHARARLSRRRGHIFCTDSQIWTNVYLHRTAPARLPGLRVRRII